VEDLFRTHAAGTHIIVASRYQETPVFEIKENRSQLNPKTLFPQQQMQLSLF
jgi:hypothetical protein